jgi:hypothetical protein
MNINLLLFNVHFIVIADYITVNSDEIFQSTIVLHIYSKVVKRLVLATFLTTSTLHILYFSM